MAESDDIDGYLVAPKAEVLAQLVARRRRPPSSSRPPRRARRSPAGWRSRRTPVSSPTSPRSPPTAPRPRSPSPGRRSCTRKVTTGTPIYTLRGNSVTPEPAPAAGAEETVDVAISDAAKAGQGRRPGGGAEVQPPRADRGLDRRLRWPRCRLGGELLDHRGPGRLPRRRRRRLPGRGRLRLLPAHLPDRADRQDRLPAALHRRRHLRRDPAPGRHADLEDHRGHQQGPRGPDLRARRLRRRSAT